MRDSLAGAPRVYAGSRLAGLSYAQVLGWSARAPPRVKSRLNSHLAYSSRGGPWDSRVRSIRGSPNQPERRIGWRVGQRRLASGLRGVIDQ